MTILVGCGSTSEAGGEAAIGMGGAMDNGDATGDRGGPLATADAVVTIRGDAGSDPRASAGGATGGGGTSDDGSVPDASGDGSNGGAMADVVLVGAGDIADCGTNGAATTASLLDAIPGTVFTAGDNAYPDATAQNFADCYEPTWGRYKTRTMPAAGNHEYHTGSATAYFTYFGPAAGDPSKGYYSYDAGAWHVVVVNSNCTEIGGCSAGTPQEQWLRSDLAAHPTACTLAYRHHALFASGQQGSNPIMRDIWKALYDFGVELVVNGHDHDYERFAPQTPDGVADATYGIRELIVGTGGAPLYPFGTPKANSEKRDNSTYGVLRLTLHALGYDWQFVAQSGKTFTDAGAGRCHGPSSAVGK
jgi:hypothetical protein